MTSPQKECHFPLKFTLHTRTNRAMKRYVTAYHRSKPRNRIGRSTTYRCRCYFNILVTLNVRINRCIYTFSHLSHSFSSCLCCFHAVANDISNNKAKKWILINLPSSRWITSVRFDFIGPCDLFACDFGMFIINAARPCAFCAYNSVCQHHEHTFTFYFIEREKERKTGDIP